ncbi:LacI family DNA-binding transcriptional regulator [Saccharopolyspora shandongensis]|uniref:LacI family DNA-binding transcriptional regulator n=1 Tax=Saccharopolyspora shandongensis TaxID=418495 RepID=UPI0033F8E878
MSADEPVTLIAVARAAGVSKTTASDALRNSGRVSEATRALVAETAIRLGYAPNPSARSLRMATTGAIGLHLPDNLTRSEYYMSFAFGAVEQAARLNYNVTLIMSQQLSETGAFLPVDGVILADPLETDPVVHRLMSSRVPVVTCERLTGPASPDGVLRSDHAPMFEELLARLHAGGARRPALLASSAAGDWGASLQAAFRRWCRGNGIPTLLRELPFGTSPEDVPEYVRELLEDHPDLDALLCAPDGSAMVALPVLRDAGREVGRDLLLASCVDSTPLQYADPPITAIDLRPREAGAECARLLFDILSGAAPKGTERTLPIGINERASTRPSG